MDAELRHGTPEEAGMNAARVAHLKKLGGRWVEEGIHPALVLLVARKGIVFLHEAFGRLGPGPDSAPLRTDAIFPVMSATKPVTAASVLLLVEEGKVGLMRPVRDYFPEISGAGTEEVLVHHLLSHLSGWRDIDVYAEVTRRLHAEGKPPPAPEPGQHRDLADFLFGARAAPLSCRPGEAMQYCQLNYELLGDLVRRASGKTIDAFARERIFEPLGMRDSSYVLPVAHRERKVRRGEGMPGPEFRGRFDPGVDSERFEGQPWGARGMHTSAYDLAVFAQMLLDYGTGKGRRVLSRAAVEAMRRNQVPEGAPVRWEVPGPDGMPIVHKFAGGYTYGLYPFLHTVSPHLNGGLASASAFGHAGALGIYWWVDPERDVVGVYCSVAARLLDDSGSDARADLFVDAVTAAIED